MDLWGSGSSSFFVLLTPLSFAQESRTAPETFSAEEVAKLVAGSEKPQVSFVVATVNIYEATLVKQNDRKVAVSFLLSNRDGVQPNIIYGVHLLKLGENGMPEALSDTYLAPEKITLEVNENLLRTFTFTASAALAAGSYQVQIFVNNLSGMNLAAVTAGKVALTQVDKAVPVKVDQCSLSVKDENPPIDYTLDQGVDIAANEQLQLSCRFTNTSETAAVFAPTFVTYRRNIDSGIEAKAESTPAQQNFTLNPAEVKNFSVDIPKALLPQAYDVKALFVDQSGVSVANDFIVAHYVLRGASGTLQNVLLDKDSYAAGDTAHATVTFSQSADAFPEARGAETGTEFDAVTVEISLLSEDGMACSASVSRSFAKSDSIHQELAFAVTRACQYPTLHARLIKTDDGTTLDEFSVSLAPVQEVQPVSQPAIVEPSTSLFKSAYSLFPLISIVVISVGLLILLVIKLRRSRGHFPVAMFVFALSVSWLVGVGESRADTMVITDGHYYNNVFSYGLNKAAYAPGETITASISGSYRISCGNRSGNVDVYVIPNQAVGGYTRASDSDGYAHLANPVFNIGTVPYWASVSFAVPAPASGWISANPYAAFMFNEYLHGHKNMLDLYFYGNNIGYSLNYPLPVNGVCSAAHYKCTTGVLGAAQQYPDQWQWWCNGSNGGRNMLCSEPRVELNFSATPTTFPYTGGNATLSWTTTGSTAGTSCWASGDWTGWQPASGSSTQSVTVTKTFTLECWNGNGTSTGPKSTTVNIAVPPLPTVDFKVNGSTGSLNLTKGDALNFTWTASDATSCTASSNDGWSGAKTLPSGSESRTANTTSTHTLTCTGPGGTTTRSVQVNVTCVPAIGTYNACDCAAEQKTRNDLLVSCLYMRVTADCDASEKNACRDFNWKESTL